MKQDIRVTGGADWLTDLLGKLDSAERQLRALGAAMTGADRDALQQRINIARMEIRRIDALCAPVAAVELPPFWSKLLQNAEIDRAPSDFGAGGTEL